MLGVALNFGPVLRLPVFPAFNTTLGVTLADTLATTGSPLALSRGVTVAVSFGVVLGVLGVFGGAGFFTVGTGEAFESCPNHNN